MNTSSEVYVEIATTSSNDTAIIDGSITVVAIGYIILGPMIMITNGIVVFVIAKWEELRETPTLWMIALMAVFDILNGFYHLLVGVPSAMLGRFAYGEELNKVAAITTAFILIQNEFNTALTVIDRFIAIQWPLHYSFIATKRNYAGLVLLTILLNIARQVSVSIPTLNVYYDEILGKPLADMTTTTGFVATALVIVIPFVVIIACSVRILARIIKTRHKVKTISQTVTVKDPIGKSTLMVMLSAGVFMLSNIPKFIHGILVFATESGKAPEKFIMFCVLSVTSASLWNVFIYMGTYRPFRDCLVKTFCRSMHKRKRQARLTGRLQMSNSISRNYTRNSSARNA